MLFTTSKLLATASAAASKFTPGLRRREWGPYWLCSCLSAGTVERRQLTFFMAPAHAILSAVLQGICSGIPAL